MKHAIIKYGTAALCALLFAGAAFALPQVFPRSVSAAAAQEKAARVGDSEYDSFEEALAAWTDGATLTLLGDAETSQTIGIGSGENKTLELGTFTLSLVGEGSGSVLKTEGTLTVKGGKISGGNAEQGGGVFVDSRGYLTLEDCEVSGNTAEKDGGGVYVAGTLMLAGETVVENNTGGGGDSNIFLSPRNQILLDGFTGRAGITAVSQDMPFVEEGESAGEFFSDDKAFVAEGGRLKTAPLQSITATYENEGKVFPTTPLSSLEEYVTVEGVNVNGAPYTGEIAFKLSGSLTVGECELTVTAEGTDGERVLSTVTVRAERPALLSFEVVVPEYRPKVYFDSPLTSLTAGDGYSFRGQYEDGIARTLYPTAEETARECGDPYITDFYTLSGDLSERKEGKATITVRAGELEQTFEVEVSKRTLSLTSEQVAELSLVEGEFLNVRLFVPSLPAGVGIVAEVNGNALEDVVLTAGVYLVRLSFVVSETENYEEIPAVFETRLTILRRELSGQIEDGSYSATKEGGLPPAWQMQVEDVTRSVYVRLDGSLEAQRVYEITLEENGVAVENPGKVEVRIPIAEELRGKEITLFLRHTDGSLEKVEAETEEDCLVFTADSLMHARYVVAVETASQIYLILSVIFGVACVLGAGAVVVYLVLKRERR